MPSSETDARQPLRSVPAPRLGLVWLMLVVWLVYSGGFLGWQLARDPLLSAYVCGSR